MQRLIIENASPAAAVRYVTSFQVTPSVAKEPARAEHVVSNDSRVEGVQVGASVVLFGRDGDLILDRPVTYTVRGGGPVRHLLTNLEPGHRYRVKPAGAPPATRTASPHGTLSFTTEPKGEQTVEVEK